MKGELSMKCVECGLPAARTGGTDIGARMLECAFECAGCGTRFLVTVELTNVQRPARPSPVLEMLGITQNDEKLRIKRILGARYAVEDLGEWLFIKKPGKPETYCIEFDSIRDTAHITRIRQTADAGGHIDRTAYEA